ncbi:Tetratricopeptide repeat protein [Rubrivivax sp. A210]|uniref:tetratricopeptide repeat protein n=1 Tax=Rubrivivax sp. A210 TaxID=2772301 RepID=UPI001919F715|nr:tetratricopeptide repeat protein [Rubrivivax sp. A210]CAD5373309.1 Tetratricopeptide repeat protein [Rubrivivax sp. A210]
MADFRQQGSYSLSAAPAPSPAAAPELVFDVTEADFQRQVLELSMKVPVLLDCWAPWCGPCRSLGPILEKLTQAYGGQFVLAKLNTDEAPQISAALRMRSIPLVVLFVGGRPVDQFVGALPEGQIREFLDKHLQPQPSQAEQLRAEAAAAPDDETALAILQEALQFEPGQPELLLDVAERLLALGELDETRAVLESIAAEARNERHAALLKRLALAAHRPPGDAAALAARIAANPRDFEARFQLGALLVWSGDYNAAFDQLLEVVMRDKAEGQPDRERARKQLVEWFEVCPDAAAVSRGRRYLGMYLN